MSARAARNLLLRELELWRARQHGHRTPLVIMLTGGIPGYGEHETQIGNTTIIGGLRPLPGSMDPTNARAAD
jgi:hypothetical protein